MLRDNADACEFYRLVFGSANCTKHRASGTAGPALVKRRRMIGRA